MTGNTNASLARPRRPVAFFGVASWLGRARGVLTALLARKAPPAAIYATSFRITHMTHCFIRLFLLPTSLCPTAKARCNEAFQSTCPDSCRPPLPPSHLLLPFWTLYSATGSRARAFLEQPAGTAHKYSLQVSGYSLHVAGCNYTPHSFTSTSAGLNLFH